MSRFSELKVTGTGFARFSNSPIARVKEAACGGAPQAKASRGTDMAMSIHAASTIIADLPTIVRKAAFALCVSGSALMLFSSIGQAGANAETGRSTSTGHALPLTPEISEKLEGSYLARLDAWASNGGKPADVQSGVVETCGRLIMVTASAAEAVAFMKERREDLDFRVDVCTKLTITRAHPQPEFSKPEIRKIVCEDMPKEQAVFETLCKRAGLR